jgi:hypothetical protein
MSQGACAAAFSAISTRGSKKSRYSEIEKEIPTEWKNTDCLDIRLAGFEHVLQHKDDGVYFDGKRGLWILKDKSAAIDAWCRSRGRTRRIGFRKQAPGANASMNDLLLNKILQLWEPTEEAGRVKRIRLIHVLSSRSSVHFDVLSVCSLLHHSIFSRDESRDHLFSSRLHIFQGWAFR